MITEDTEDRFFEDTEFEEILEENENDIIAGLENNDYLDDETLQEIENATQAVIVDDIHYTGDIDDFGDTLQLTEYVDPTSNNELSVVAEYQNIDIVKVAATTKKQAKALVDKITNFIIGFNDIQLTEDHKNYIKDVGRLELDGLQDVLALSQYNKLMIDNIIRRINAVQGDDYAMIQSYSSLVNQQMRLQKDLHQRYKSIPMVMKKMRIEVLCNQELGEDQTKVDQLNAEVNNMVGLTSTKDKIRALREKHENENRKQ